MASGDPVITVGGGGGGGGGQCATGIFIISG